MLLPMYVFYMYCLL